MVKPRELPKPVARAFEDIYRQVTDSEFSFAKPRSKTRYVGTLSAHFGSWGVPPSMSSEIAHHVFDLHSRLVAKVGPFLRKTYGPDYEATVHDYIKNALIRIYGDASTGLLSEVARNEKARRAYLGALAATVHAVQPNAAITDHVIREGYSIAPYAAFVYRHPHIYGLLERALRRRYPRYLTDLRHMLELIISSNHSEEYLRAADSAIRDLLVKNGKDPNKIPRQHIGPYVTMMVPYAIHASLIDTPVRSGFVGTAWEVHRFLFGPSGKNNFSNFRLLLQDPGLYPVLLGIAKHWNGELNPRLWAVFSEGVRHGKRAISDFVATDGRVAWEDLWPHISQSYVHKAGDSTFISISKLNTLDQLRALSEQPTCLYPANLEGQKYGVEYVLNTRKGDIMPIIAVAHSISGKNDRIVGRLTMFLDPQRGNLHIVSTPVGSVGLRQYVDAAKGFARVINESAGENVVKRVLVGGQGDLLFHIPVDDAYGDMIVKKRGRHYLRDASVVPVE